MPLVGERFIVAMPYSETVAWKFDILWVRLQTSLNGTFIAKIKRDDVVSRFCGHDCSPDEIRTAAIDNFTHYAKLIDDQLALDPASVADTEVYLLPTEAPHYPVTEEVLALPALADADNDY